MARNEVRVTITGDAQGLRTSLNQAEGHLEGFRSRMEAVGTKLRSVGETMTLGLTLPIVGGLAIATKWAGELEDAEAMSDQVFDNMSEDMKRWADNSAQAFGLSSGDAIEWANQMGIRLRQIGGLSEEVAATTSQNLVQLAGDFASAFGGSVDEAAQALSSALTGEFEPLKRYGVVINDAALKNKLFQMTGKEVTGTLTAQEKQMATLALITEQASLVQGDYGRNAEGATNKQRTATASLKDAATTIGETLLPVVTTLAEGVATLAQKFQDLDPTLQKIIIGAVLVVAALGPIIYIAGLLATAIGFLATPVGLLVAGLAALAAGFLYLYKNNEGFREWVNTTAATIRDKLGKAIEWFVDNIWPRIVDAFNTLKDDVIPPIAEKIRWFADDVWPRLYDAFITARDKIKEFGDWFTQEFWPKVREAIDEFKYKTEELREELAPILESIKLMWQIAMGVIYLAVKGAVELIGPQFTFMMDSIASTMSNGFRIISGVVLGSLDVIRGIIKVVTGVITLDWGRFTEGLRLMAEGQFRAISSVIGGFASQAQQTLGNIANYLGNVFQGPMERARGAIVTGIILILGTLSGLATRIANAVGNLGDTLYNAGRQVMDGLRRGIEDAWNRVRDLLRQITGLIPTWKGPIDKDAKLLYPAGVAIMDGLEEGIETAWPNVRSLLQGMVPEISATVMPGTATVTGPQPVMAGVSGPSITVNVTAGVGDPAEIGRVVVDTIKAYEQRNGVTWRAA